MKLLTPDLGLFIWNLLAFLIVLLILKKFAWKPILSSLKQREQSISDSLLTAERVKAEMAQLKSENEALMAKAREERAVILKEAKEVKDKIINDAKEQAKVEVARIMSDAETTLENRKMAVLTDVKNQMGNLAIEVAAKLLRRELSNQSEQEAYIKELTKEVKLN